jgi:hypothetical protein
MLDTNASIVAIGDTERLYDNPDSRRAWLLSKALENLPLLEALDLAETAERFLSGDPSESSSTTAIFYGLGAANAVGLPAMGETPVAVSNCIDTDHGWQTADTAKLTVLASIADITRYLRQHGELIASDEFEVNGQSEVTRDELLARANHLRVRQGLPTYALLPTAPVAATPKNAEPRPPKPYQPPSRKERKQWAQQVTAL